MKFKTISLPYERPLGGPADEDNSDQYTAAIPRNVISLHSSENDLIFDPFIGFGTTAIIAEELNRIPYGIEADRIRFEWAAGQVQHWNHIVHDDALNLESYNFPKMDLCVTSPPFMPMDDDWNPLYSGDPNYAEYSQYLGKLESILIKTKEIMKPGAPLFIHTDDIETSVITPLINDMHNITSKHFDFVEMIKIEFSGEETPDDYQSTHLLHFRA